VNAYPKQNRQVDISITQQARERDGYCLWGLVKQDGCSGGIDGDHIDTRGSGGDDDLTNVITLCRRHHNEAHAGRITKEQLRATLSRFHGYTYDEA